MRRITRIVMDPVPDLSPLDAYIGKSCAQINSELGLGINMFGKSFVRYIIDRMISKCDIHIESPRYEYKMIRVDQFGRAKNPASMRITDYHEIINEEWETSDLRKMLEPTYIFFVVTHGSPQDSIFKGYVIHTFTDEEMESARYVWKDTRDKIREGTYDRFLTDKDTGTFFFKIHATSVSDQTDAPGGGREVIRSFWISRTLISRIVSDVR